MSRSIQDRMRGYTIVELLTTILIVAILATIVGVLFARLLTLQENEREEAYFRERLSDICGMYADYLSVAKSINTNRQMTVVKYREETGGVSLETGRVSRVTRLTTANRMIDATGRAILDLKFGAIEGEDGRKDFVSRISRFLRGDAELIPLAADDIRCSISPLNYRSISLEADNYFGNLCTTDAALAKVLITARYKARNHDGELVMKTLTAERIVRLWNRE